MKGDYSTLRRWPAKHYSSVRTQQGRVQLDSDWHDQIEIQQHLDRTEAIDVIGPAGGPKGAAGGFRIGKNADGTDLSISRGHFWVGGLLCELESDASYLSQPDLPAPPFATDGALDLPDGSYVVYLDAWERHVTALEDRELLEPALRGVDTTTRTRVIAQVKLLQVTEEGGGGGCDSVFPEWEALVQAPTGALTARAVLNAEAADRCSVETSGGYRRLENQLYRVEIHAGGDRDTASFKWSRENGSVVTGWVGLSGNVLSVATAGRDGVLGFAAGDWIELSDDERELTGLPGVLVRLSHVDGTELTIDAGTFDPPATVLALGDFKTNPKVRRWEISSPNATSAAGALLPTPAGDGFIELEDGVQVKFEAGSYPAGAYWVVPARTVVGDVLWPRDAVTKQPLPQPAHGIRHHYARLALVRKAGASLEVTSCYPQFPPLTALTASDVAFDNGNCAFNPSATTVQQALDWLCQQGDLDFHKKHLHGWGIVCGLQVVCGPDSPDPNGVTIHDTITVKNGYAVDGDGKDIIVDARDAQGNRLPGDVLKILDLIRAANALPIDPVTQKFKDGSVSLFFKRGRVGETYGVEPYDAGSESLPRLLEHTFWWDVYDHCILRIIDAFKDEFGGTDEASAEHLIAFLNVLAQLIIPAAGARVFISPKEDQILRRFYAKLRAILQSQTFCAMFDGISEVFPDYDPIYAGVPASDPRPSAVLSGSLCLRTRMRVDPAGKRAFVLGGQVSGSDEIGIFDVEYDAPVPDEQGQPTFPHAHEKRLGTTKFPTSGAVVQDLAFSKDGKTIYVLAVLNKTDTLYASADVSDPSAVRWNSPVTTLCSTPLVTLAYSARQDKYYAIGSKGLYQIDPRQLVPNQQPIVQFKGCGHLVIVDAGSTSYAFFTIGDAPNYDAVGRVDLQNLPQLGGAPFTYTLPAPGNDDIAAAFDPSGAFQRLFVVVKPSGQLTSKQLLVYNALATAPPQPLQSVPVRYVPPGGQAPSGVDSSIYRLAYESTSERLLILSADAFLIETYDARAAGGSLTSLVHPTQIAPVAIVASPAARYVFVLNTIGGTISTVPVKYFTAQPQAIVLDKLAEYHTDVLQAFIALFAQFTQYLKDCICHHLLLECPDDREKTLYLARIDVKNGHVYNICNFSRRKYLHTFPGVEYWMSVVPILPLMRKAIGDACCAILQNKIASKKVAKPDGSPDFIETSSVLNILAAVGQADLKSVWSKDVAGRFGSLSSAASALFGGVRTAPPAPATAPAATLPELRQQPSESATQTLGNKGILVVGRETVKADNLLDMARAPTALRAGDRVVLITDEHSNVVGYKRAPAPLSGTDVQSALAERDQQIANVEKQITESRAAHAAELRQRDQQIAQLQAELVKVQSAQQALAERDEQFAKIGARLSELDDLVRGRRPIG
jgi:hypothetical protein